ncbi:hypothetical protein EON64_16185 [archaeon]|nr:MAG: hypothetical protein EON64_16185 [archaeon]
MMHVHMYMCRLLDSVKKNIRKESCWTISNITAGTAEQIQAVIGTYRRIVSFIEQSNNSSSSSSLSGSGIFPRLVDLLSNGEFDIQKEAAWAVSNATSGGTTEQIMYLIQVYMHSIMSSISSTEDTDLSCLAL